MRKGVHFRMRGFIAKSTIKNISTIVVSLLVTIVLLEVALRSLRYINIPFAQQISQHLNYDWPMTTKGWAYRYISSNPENKDFSQSKVYDLHPTRGWTYKPNADVWINGNHWETNTFGHRALTTPQSVKKKKRILVFGDSQTAGDEVDDRFVWPTLLQEKIKDEYEVINLAVGGYGLSQMYLTLLEEYEKWQPDIVVYAVITDDLYRSALKFRSIDTPYLKKSQDNQFSFEYPSAFDNKAIIKKHLSSWEVFARRSKLYTFMQLMLDKLIDYPQNLKTAYEINQYALKSTKDFVLKYPETKIIFALMLYPAEVANPLPTKLEQQFNSHCTDFSDERFVCVNSRNYVKRVEDYRQGGGHYYRKGNEMVAEMVKETLYS